jgi:DNA-binding NtrC family response regulator
VPAELFEAEMFGHEKGAFTGANQSRAGWFEQAQGGTLFLDEIGELPLAMQVKLLRVLQEGEVRRVGASVARKLDVRLVAATHRDLGADVAAGAFREDLFYRVAVAVLHLPPLRERPGDLPVLLDHLWAQVCREGCEDPGWIDKYLSAGARNLLALQYWPGNVRDLLNTLRRAALWADGGVVTAADVQEALTNPRSAPADSVLDRELGGGFDLPDLLATVAKHYLQRAVAESAGNKTRAAQLVGLASYQTLSNWLNKYGLSESSGLQSAPAEQSPASWHGSGKA